MSNMTKAIAVLGVVAGLGVAVLPLSTYAAPTKIEGTAENEGDPLSAGKDVQVQLKLDESLSMYVTNEAGDADVTTPVALNENTDTTANYQAAPIAIKVIANNAQGYHLTIHGSANDTLTGATGTVATSLTNAKGTQIEAGDLTSTSASQWGYKVLKGAAGSVIDATWNGVPAEAAAAEIDGAKVPTGAAGNTTKVTFGAHVLDTQESGIYNGQVTFTATAGLKAGA